MRKPLKYTTIQIKGRDQSISPAVNSNNRTKIKHTKYPDHTLWWIQILAHTFCKGFLKCWCVKIVRSQNWLAYFYNWSIWNPCPVLLVMCLNVWSSALVNSPLMYGVSLLVSKKLVYFFITFFSFTNCPLNTHRYLIWVLAFYHLWLDLMV